MARTGVVIDRRYMDHDMGAGHPECPERISVLLDALESRGLPRGAEGIAPREATHDEIALIHDRGHIERIRATEGKAHTYLDPDTSTSAGSYRAALLAAGGFLELVASAHTRSIENGFALVRPPGHHATFDRAMGFCLFNNVAIGARWAVRAKGLRRVLIVDWDVHHGNGTQDAFYDDPQVLYFSMHRYPYYPGSGGADEVGRGKGEGLTVNVPLPYGCGDAEYLAAFTRVLLPIARQFSPELVLVSAGFDPHEQDPLGGMKVTSEGFAVMASLLLTLSREAGGAPVLFILEGGYSLEGLRGSVLAVLNILCGGSVGATVSPATASDPSRVDQHLDSIWKIQKKYWKAG